PRRFYALSILSRPGAGPAWSPNGRVLAVLGTDVGPTGSQEPVVICVEVSSRSERTIRLPLPSSVGNLADGLIWVNDGTLVLVAPSSVAGPAQVWRLSYPAGTFARLTNDLIGYKGLSTTVTSAALVTSRTDPRASVWVGDGRAREGTEVVPPASFFGG